jgi:hypothetical protein
MALLEKTGLYGVPLHTCQDDVTTHSKWDDPIKNGKSGHPKLTGAECI